MPEIHVDEHSALARLASLHERRTGARVAAVSHDSREPAFVVGNEVFVDVRDGELLEEMTGRGGELVPEPPLPEGPMWSGDDEAPPMRRRGDVDMDVAPRVVTIRFSDAPRGVVRELGALLEHDERAGRRLDFSDPLAADLAAIVTERRLEGRRIGLNPVGVPFTMPMSTATEGSGMAFPADPFSWAQYAGGSKVVEAWQLVDSYRQIRGGLPAVFVAISDTGFWLDATGRPRVAAGQAASDFGGGVMQWNLQNEGQPATGPSSVSGTFHGNAVASCAVGAVNNAAGAAGSGGTVARPCFFLTSLTAEHAMRCARLCVWWGIDVLNMSWGFWGQSEFWFDTDTWDDTFNWAGANGSWSSRRPAITHGTCPTIRTCGLLRARPVP